MRAAAGHQASHLPWARAGPGLDLPGVSWAQGQEAAAWKGEPGSQEHWPAERAGGADRQGGGGVGGEHRDRCGQRGVSACGQGSQGPWGGGRGACCYPIVCRGGDEWWSWHADHPPHPCRGLRGHSPALLPMVSWASSGCGTPRAPSEHHPPRPPGAPLGASADPPLKATSLASSESSADPPLGDCPSPLQAGLCFWACSQGSGGGLALTPLADSWAV